MNFLLSVLEQGLIFSVVSLGVYISYKILDFPDLSVDGSFPLGAAVTALCLTNGINPFVAIILSFLAGCVGGLLTGILHVKFKITNLLSGILVMLALYSINLRIMGKPNIALYNEKTIFLEGIPPIVIIITIAIICKIAIDLFFKTKLGFVLISSGDNPQLVTSLGVSKGYVITIGLMLSNGLVALAGSMLAQHQHFVDISMGTGTIIIGLASIILGTSLLKKINFLAATTITVLGAMVYKLIIGFAIAANLPPSDMNLITALIVIIALGVNNSKFKLKFNKNQNIGGDSSAETSQSA